MRKLVMMVMSVMAIALSVGAMSLAKVDASSVSRTAEPRSVLLFGTGLLIVGGILRRSSADRTH
jgi:hypothetical protein